MGVSGPSARAPSGSTAAATPAHPARGCSWRVRDWALWQNAPRVLAYVLVVDVLAVVLAAVLAPSDPVAPDDLVLAGLLALGSMTHIEVARHLERLREVEATDRAYIDLKSMWSFAGLLLLPLGPALGLVAAAFCYWWLRVSRRPVLHRWLFSGATVVLASIAAWALVLAPPVFAGHRDLTGPLGLLVVCLAALLRWWVNIGLVAGALTLVSPTTSWWRRFVGNRTETVLGLGALALGILLAALCELSPWLLPILLVPLLTMHRGIRLHQLVRASLTDAKTGLATPTHWEATAARALADARRHRRGLGVLMIDLDHFKSVNDRWGHLVGDRVLHAVAQVVLGEIRAGDAAGRFGGEEFVVLLTDVDADEIAGVAERLRAQTTVLAVPATTPGEAVSGLSISVGTAVFPTTATTLDDLLLAADTALYEAKRGGRDRVRTAPR